MTSYEKVGYRKGKREGKLEGEKGGFAKGEQASLTKVASRMLAEGLPRELVAKVTGLPDSEIDKLLIVH